MTARLDDASTDSHALLLWREVLGDRLRVLRLRRGETLAAVARRAGVAPQYLSEVERGLKDPSSEMIAAISGALGVGLLDLTIGVARELRDHETATIAAVTSISTATAIAPTSMADGLDAHSLHVAGDVQLALAA